MYIQETYQLLTVAFWKKTREHVSIIYCSLSFYLSCIDLLMMYDRSICANCNFRWEHFPLSKFIAEVILEFAVIGEQTVVCKVLELYAKGRGGRLGYTEMLRAVIRFDYYCHSASQGRKDNFNKWICKEMFMHVFGVTQKNLIITAIEIVFLIFFCFISELKMSLLKNNFFS